MKITKSANSNLQFNLEGISFLELKTIKEACIEYVKQGSTAAHKLVIKINKEMDNLTI